LLALPTFELYGFVLIAFLLFQLFQLLFVSVSANNLLDRKYIDHLSTLKEVNLYNPGRNIIINLKIPFEMIIDD